ncbi:hypothetical protein CROQUDRAFT_90186 [Cronartium quercuum f. sp. fusiforme G11]|uniref:Uncharacterized protein n=1 Tax=Cronartium quercuum f. sp. fusiforme G11 TaxID=708437 RepID=A0A9P6NRZ9_9BASI|nr:hypothetical protein CROQUDRAFT_90186 [Cronartium quercuum f. sp. fusiforme G11]
MPIDFYDLAWFNKLLVSQKSKVANTHCIFMLLNAKLSFCAVLARDKRLGDQAFVAKYWDKLTGVYGMGHELGSRDESEEDEDDPQDSDYGTEIDLDDTSGEEDQEEEDALDEEDKEEGTDFE